MPSPSQRFLLTFLVALLLTPLLARAGVTSRSDVVVNAWIPQRAQAADSHHVNVGVSNAGPDVIREVVVRVSGLPGQSSVDGVFCRQTGNGECTIDVLFPGPEVQIDFAFQTAFAEGAFEIEIRAETGPEDGDLTNNRVAGRMVIVRAPLLRFYFSGDTPDPGSPAKYTAQIWNESEYEAEDVTFSFPLPEGWGFERSESDELQCTAVENELRCRLARIPARSSMAPQFVLRTPPSPEGAAPHSTVPVRVTTKHGLFNETDLFYWFGGVVFRHLVVSTTRDEGAGTLRQAIEQANAECVGFEVAPCKVVFDIGQDAPGGVFTIRPTTPLPPIRSDVLTIDGSTQTARHGDSNTLGPEVELDGSLLTGGDGLEVHSRFFVLRELVINRFPGNGVTIPAAGDHRLVERCYIGTDATGRQAAPNGSRGVVVEVPSGGMAWVRLLDNVISGNRRAGIFFASGHTVSIVGNRIGSGAGPDLVPLGNGASGVYVGPATAATVIQNNVIAFNAHAGLATDPRSSFVAVHGNTFTDNGGLGIDHGLDGVTPNLTVGYRESPNHPILTSARYDQQSRITRVEGRVELPYLPGVQFVELFVSDHTDPSGFGEAQRSLGRVAIDAALRFALDTPHDLRGFFITATLTVPNNYYPEIRYLKTSELSRAVQVEGEQAGPLDAVIGLPAGADLSVVLNEYSSPPEVAAGGYVFLYGAVDNLGPLPAEEVVVDVTVSDASRWTLGPGVPCRDVAGRVRCTLGRIEPLGSSSFTLVLKASLTPGPVTVRGMVRSSTEDRVPANDESSRQFNISTAPLLETRVSSEVPVDPGATADYSVSVAHRSGIDAQDVTVTIPLPAGWVLEKGPEGEWQCHVRETALLCRAAVLTARSTSTFHYTLRAPASREGQALRAERLSTTSATGVLGFLESHALLYGVYRLIPVTTIEESGAGSLRASIDTANLLCSSFNAPCRIVFELDPSLANGGVFTIRPATPLPRITADAVIIDGRSQMKFGGNTNPAGPEIELNGSLLNTGHGLELASIGNTGVRGVAVNGFPWNGVQIFQSPSNYGTRRVIADNYIGTDPTGTRAVPNGWRGISVETVESFPTAADLVGNVIAGNSRSAIFVTSGRDLRIVQNRIGLTAGDGPVRLGHGASGIYLGAVEGVQVHNNVIAYSAHTGLSLDRSARWISIRQNSIFENGQLAIDYGLDLVTRNDDPGRPEELPVYPEILSALWDPSSGVTRIEGTITTSGQAGIVEIFANDRPDPTGFGETQISVGEVTLDGLNESRHFALEIRSDLRGRFITATFTRRSLGYLWAWTSEVSPAVAVP